MYVCNKTRYLCTYINVYMYMCCNKNMMYLVQALAYICQMQAIFLLISIRNRLLLGGGAGAGVVTPCSENLYQLQNDIYHVSKDKRRRRFFLNVQILHCHAFSLYSITPYPSHHHTLDISYDLYTNVSSKIFKL